MFGLPGFRESNPAAAFISGNRNLKPAPGLQNSCSTPFGEGVLSLLNLNLFTLPLSGMARIRSIFPDRNDLNHI